MAGLTAIRQDRTFMDSYGIAIHFYQWKAETPRAVVQLAHGLGEYACRHEDVVERLVQAGYTVYADDHRGHGRTGLEQWGGDAKRLGRLGPGGLGATVDEVRQLTMIVRSENPGLPLALLGHSWGSLMAQQILDEHGGDLDAVVLTGSAYRTLRHMNGGDLNKRHYRPGGTGYEWLSRDESVGAAFAADPLAFSARAVKLFGIADSLRLLGRPTRNPVADVPVLIQSGSDDPFGGARSVELLARAYRERSRLSDVELIVYPDARHEIFKELDGEQAMMDTIGWLDSRLAAGS